MYSYVVGVKEELQGIAFAEGLLLLKNKSKLRAASAYDIMEELGKSFVCMQLRGAKAACIMPGT